MTDQEVPLECRRDYLIGEWYNACSLMEYYEKWWKKEEDE